MSVSAARLGVVRHPKAERPLARSGGNDLALAQDLLGVIEVPVPGGHLIRRPGMKCAQRDRGPLHLGLPLRRHRHPAVHRFTWRDPQIGHLEVDPRLPPVITYDREFIAPRDRGGPKNPQALPFHELHLARARDARKDTPIGDVLDRRRRILGKTELEAVSAGELLGAEVDAGDRIPPPDQLLRRIVVAATRGGNQIERQLGGAPLGLLEAVVAELYHGRIGAPGQGAAPDRAGDGLARQELGRINRHFQLWVGARSGLHHGQRYRQPAGKPPRGVIYG